MPGLAAGCSSMSADAPATAAATPQAAAPARQPDGYPNLNIVPKPANAQITDAEKAALIDELSAKRPQAGGTAANAAEAERLRLLARQQIEQTLNQIEASQ
jgi:hypothetical protein